MLDICRGELCVCICIASRVQKIISRIGDRRRFAHGAETEETTTKTANSVHTLTSTYRYIFNSLHYVYIFNSLTFPSILDISLISFWPFWIGDFPFVFFGRLLMRVAVHMTLKYYWYTFSSLLLFPFSSSLPSFILRRNWWNLSMSDELVYIGLARILTVYWRFNGDCLSASTGTEHDYHYSNTKNFRLVDTPYTNQ